MTDLARPLAAYLGRHLKHERGVSPHTVKSCVAAFRLLAGFLAERRCIRPCELEIGHLDADGILAFLDHLEAERETVSAPATSGWRRSRASPAISSSDIPSISTSPPACAPFPPRRPTGRRLTI